MARILLRRVYMRPPEFSWLITRAVPSQRVLSAMSGSGITEQKQQEDEQKALEAAVRENRLDFQSAARILMSTPAKERKFGWDFHFVQFFFACLPPLAAYLVAQYSRSEQRKMEKDLDLKLEAIVDAELEIELEVELEEAATILSSSNPDVEALGLRLEAMEERLRKLEPTQPGPANANPKAEGTSTSAAEEGKQSPVKDVAASPPDPVIRLDQYHTTNEKKVGGYWRWWSGKRSPVKDDIHAREQDQKAERQPHANMKQMKQEHQ